MSAANEDNIIFQPQLLTTLKGYKTSDLAKDLISGLIVAIIALPLSIALAICSGVTPQIGLYTAIVAGFVVAALGGCKVQIAGPTAAFATMIAGITARSGMNALCISTCLAGLLMMLAGALRLGKYIRHIPKPVTVGFTGGIAITILVGQFKDFFGITYANGEKPIEAIEKIELFAKYLPSFNPYALLLGIISLLIIIYWPKVPKAGSIVPSSLIAVIASVLITELANSFVSTGIKTIGDFHEIKAVLPSFSLPSFKGSLNWLSLVKDGFMIAVLASIESLLSAVVADEMTNDKTRPNTELIAQGVGNVASVLFGGIPATGAIARTAANIKNGGKTPIAGMFHAIMLLAMLMFLSPLASIIPMPCIAAILFSVAYNMSGWRNFIMIIFDLTVSKRERMLNILVLFVTFILTVVKDLVISIAAGLIIYAIGKTVIARKSR